MTDSHLSLDIPVVVVAAVVLLVIKTLTEITVADPARVKRGIGTWSHTP